MGWQNHNARWMGLGLLVALSGLGCNADTMDPNPYQQPGPQAGTGNVQTPTPGPGQSQVPNPDQNTVGPDQSQTPTPNPGQMSTSKPGPGPGPGPGPDQTQLGDVPCGVQQVVQRNCHTCHGATPIGGAIRLVTVDDWHKLSMSPKYDTTKEVYEIASIRINDGTMPQGRQMEAQELATLDTWLKAGAHGATSDQETTCEDVPDNDVDECDRPGARDPLVAREGETCWAFPVHGVPGPNDTSKFAVQPGESYHEWYYDVPWPQGHVATRFGADFDNLDVLHHYLTFQEPGSARNHGDLDTNVTGTTLGASATLISGWAVGGCNIEMPDGVGVELDHRGKIMIQWHLYNTTGGVQMDGSKVQVCTVPQSQVEHVAGITFLGTENFNSVFGMGPGKQTFATTCNNLSGQPITVVGWVPHMHLLGTRMTTELVKPDGTSEVVFDEPFQFDYQIHYMADPLVTVQPGEALKTTCEFQNDTGANVAFGQSTNQEMCYQFTLAYPAGALNNGVPSLIGALNTCW